MEKYNISPVGLYNVLLFKCRNLINIYFLCIYFVTDCWSLVFDPFQTHVLQHTRFPCLSLSSRVYSNSCPSSQWCHPTISSSVIPFSSCLQSFPASGSFPVSQLFASFGQSIGASGSSSVLPIKSWLVSLKIGLIALLLRVSRESSPAPQFENINSLVLSYLYGPALISIHDY